MNNKNQWLYAHNSDFDIMEANKIQVCHMCDAYSMIDKNITLLSFGSNSESIRKKYFINAGVKTIFIKPGKSPLLRSLRLFFYFLKLRNNFSFIHTRDSLFAYLVKIFFPSKKVFFELHDVPIKISRRYVLKKCYKQADFVIVITHAIKKILSDRGFPNLDKVIVLPDAVDLEKFENIEKNFFLKKSVGVKTILYSGSLKDGKGFETFLESSKNFKESRTVKFFIAGGKEKETDNLKKRYSWVEFIGWVPHDKIPTLLHEADILVLPNSVRASSLPYTSSPMKLFEYMAARRPIITSDLPNIREIVSEEHVQFFEADNYGDLSLKITKLLSDDDLSKKLSDESFKKVKEFTWKSRAQKIVGLDQKIYGENKEKNKKF